MTSLKETFLPLLVFLVHVTVGFYNDNLSSRWRIGLHCGAVKEQKEQSTTTVIPDEFVCNGCGERYQSRNSLFRHLRGSDEASLRCPLAESKECVLLHTMVVRYGFHIVDEDIDSASEYAARCIEEAFCEVAHAKNISVRVSGLSYSTATRLRQISLAQDRSVRSAASEFLSLNYKAVGSQPCIENWKEYAGANFIDDFQSFVNSRVNVTSNCRIIIHHADALVPRDASISAEQSCTQMAYKYMMPLTWVLPLQSEERLDAERELERWWKEVSIQSKESFQRQYPGKKWNLSSPKIIKMLKHSLKTVESETVANRKTRRQSLGEGGMISNDRDGPQRLAHGRYGQVSTPEELKSPAK